VGFPSKCVDPVLLLELATPETHWAETSQIEPMVDPVLLVALEIGSAVTADVAVEIASAVPEAVVAEDSVYSAVPAAAVFFFFFIRGGRSDCSRAIKGAPLSYPW